MKKKLTFKMAYFIYVGVLVIFVIASALYVSRLLQKYEDTRPEQYVKNAYEDMVLEAKDGSLWNKYFLPEFETGEYEASLNVEKTYEKILTTCEAEFVQENGDYPEDEMYYKVVCDGAKVAEAKLKAKGPAVTKLAILSYREWEVEYLKPVIEKGDYTLLVPEEFTVKANGIALNTEDGKKDGKGEVKYTIEGVYFAPQFEIRDSSSKEVFYTISDNRVEAEYYYYKLNLPDTIRVTLNGNEIQAVSAENHMAYYEVKELTRPEVILTDLYGNSFTYEGGKKIPLTHKAIMAENGYQVTVKGNVVPDGAVMTMENPEYEALRDYVSDLPDLTFYNVAVLEDNVRVAVTDVQGDELVLDDGETNYSFTAQDKYLETVPEEVSDEVDVLSLAQKWSLFMSADLTFKEMSQYLIKDSYQYDVAVKYATGVDIKFISGHELAAVPFTEETVTNFVWISDNCFSVDIGFVKHMVLTVGSRVEDPMNDRFYFVKYDDTDDGVNNPTWKIAGMKEIIKDAE